ncbi:MAG: Ig-like domain-containing protein [Deltaproteobacteria bacterium]|nr:Ig-like domain-containing protein [Deltaproteobacteria bacterium]
MRAHVRVGLTLALFGTAALGSWACPTPSEEEPPEPILTITASPKMLPGDGRSTDISVAAAEADGALGVGNVTLTTTRGNLGEEGVTETILELSNGRTSIKYWCNATSDTSCFGAQRITAKWKNLTAVVTVTFSQLAGPDASASDDGGTTGMDAGSSGADAGTADGGTTDDGGSTDANTSAFALSITTGRSSLYSQVGASTEVTARLTSRDAGVAAQIVTVSVDLGELFVGTDGGTPPVGAPSLDLETDQTGRVRAQFRETGAPGQATISASHASGASASTKVDILKVATITYQGMTCGGSPCTMLGINGSGWNEKSDIFFRVLDNAGKPAAGVPVTFTFSNPDVPEGTTIAPTGVTDVQGNVKTSASSGPIIGVFTVKATAVPPPTPVEAVSTPIGVRGAKPSNYNMTFTCYGPNDRVNVPAYSSPTPPLSIQNKCTVKLLDRYNNPVGTGAQVYFKTEAGGIPNSITTQAFNPTTDNKDEGVGVVVFSTNGTWPPRNVEPLPANPNQWPIPLEAEPNLTISGNQVVNPRDGLVTIIAYTSGEEYLNDANQNGTADPGETFIDQEKPFVDADDNGTFDSWEVSPGTWAPANGSWDRDTTIWTETHILYTGDVVDDPRYSHLLPNPFPTASLSEPQTVDVYFADRNLNRPESGCTWNWSYNSIYVDLFSITLLQDGYGFGLDHIRVDSADERECVIGTTQVCKWKTIFSTWGRGKVNQVRIIGDSDNTPPIAASISIGIRSPTAGIWHWASTTGNVRP